MLQATHSPTIRVFANIERPALRKLAQFGLARGIEDLLAPPATRPDPLKGDRASQWSLRVNDQFRLGFRWTGSDAEEAEIVGHHNGLQKPLMIERE